MQYNILPMYKKPIDCDVVEPSYEYSFFEKSQEACEAQEYEEAIVCIIKYINEVASVENNFLQTLKLDVNQEKCNIILEVKNGKFYLEASLVEITEKTNKIALYRRVAEFNFSTLLTPQIKLENDQLKIKYECDLHLVTPHKLYNAIKNTTINGSYILNVLEDKYHTKTYANTKLRLLSDEKQNEALKQINELLTQHEEYIKIFKNSRYANYQWDNTLLTLFKIGCMPYVNGYLKDEIDETIDMMYNDRIEFQERVEKGNVFIQKLAKRDIQKYIYQADRFMTVKYKFFVSEIQDRLENDEDTIKKHMNDNNFLPASYMMQILFLRLDYYYDLNDTYKHFIRSSLEEISNKKLEYGAKKLYDLYQKMLKEELKSQTDEEEEELFNERYDLNEKQPDQDSEALYTISNMGRNITIITVVVVVLFIIFKYIRG